jgi:ankyrin repeat protein
MYVTLKNKQVKRIRILEFLDLPNSQEELDNKNENKNNVRKIKYMDDEGRTPLMIHSIDGNLEELKNVFYTSEMNCEDEDGWTALMYAANHGHIEIVRFLIEQGADRHGKTHSGWTAPQLARFNGHYEIAALFI